MNSTVLIVDDTPTNLELLVSYFELEGIDIQIAESGLVALEQLQETHPSLILLDIMMPGIDGLETCRRIKENSKTADIPIIFMTALNDLNTITQAFECGGVDYVTKPLRREEVLARVQTHMKIAELQMELKLRQQELEANNVRLEASQRKLRLQISQAAAYSRSLLPKGPVPPLKVNYVFQPSDALGGDGIGFNQLDDNHIALYILDVCGHGVGAALLSVSLLNVLRLQTLSSVNFHSPSDVLTSINRAFPSDRNNNMFFTIWYGVYNVRDGVLKYASAGHHAGIVFEKDKAGIWKNPIELTQSGMAAGLLPHVNYQNRMHRIQSGSRLFLFSDGVFELESADDNTPFTFEQFIASLPSVLDHPEQDVQTVLANMQAYQGSLAFEDDFSLLRVEFP